MIDPEIMDQLQALSREIAALRTEFELLSGRVESNNANLMQRLGVELALVRDAANRAGAKTTEFGGHLDEFTDEQRHFKTDFEWWTNRLDELSKRAEMTLKRLNEAETRLEGDHQSFKEWAVEKISQIGRIYRR